MLLSDSDKILFFDKKTKDELWFLFSISNLKVDFSN